MKTLLVAASAIGLLASAPAMAATSATGEIALSATVDKACGVGNHLSGAAADAAWDQSDITVDLDDANGQFAGAEYTNRSFGNVWCNAPAAVTLEIGALKTDVAIFDGSSFTNAFDIQVNTNAGVYLGQGSNYVAQTTNGADFSLTGPTLPGAFETGLRSYGGANSIKVLKNGLNKRPVAGTYAGYIRFTATAS